LNQSPNDPEWRELVGYTPESAKKEMDREHELQKAGAKCYVDISLMSLRMLKCAAQGKPAIDQLVDKFKDLIPDAIKALFQKLLDHSKPAEGPGTSKN
jgi:hypothetical protein